MFWEVKVDKTKLGNYDDLFQSCLKNSRENDFENN